MIEFVAKALILTALTMAVWVYVVRVSEEARAEAGCSVGYVYDGDTVELICDGAARTARIVGLDTPETRDARCAAERRHGRAATERLRALIKARGAAVDIWRRGHDKYGRVLIRLHVDGTDVAETLIGEGGAVPYRGGARIDWCARLEAA
ncbi:MAG: nuclease [Rhodobacterales bacterium]|nr:MAG: nuclease [Rhodobacterales bacterium]